MDHVSNVLHTRLVRLLPPPASLLFSIMMRAVMVTRRFRCIARTAAQFVACNEELGSPLVLASSAPMHSAPVERKVRKRRKKAGPVLPPQSGSLGVKPRKSQSVPPKKKKQKEKYASTELRLMFVRCNTAPHDCVSIPLAGTKAAVHALAAFGGAGAVAGSAHLPPGSKARDGSADRATKTMPATSPSPGGRGRALIRDTPRTPAAVASSQRPTRSRNTPLRFRESAPERAPQKEQLPATGGAFWVCAVAC